MVPALDHAFDAYTKTDLGTMHATGGVSTLIFQNETGMGRAILPFSTPIPFVPECLLPLDSGSAVDMAVPRAWQCRGHGNADVH